MVYFITDGEYFKIGSSKNPEKRLLELQTGNPRKLSLFKTMKGGSFMERMCHDIFSEAREINEWFKIPEQEVLNVVNALSEDIDDNYYVSDKLGLILEKVQNLSTFRLWSWILIRKKHRFELIYDESMRFSERSFYGARKELVDLGLIEKIGKKTYKIPKKYIVFPLCD